MHSILKSTMILALGLALAACGGDADGKGPSTETESLLPADLVVTALEGEPQTITQVKASAKVGAEVLVKGYIGGSAEPFQAELAAFTIADTDIVTPCNERPADSCPIPWDFCCDPPDKRAAAMASVQVVDAKGLPVAQGLEGHGGLAKGGRIIVKGTVTMAEAGNLVIDAAAIRVVR